jgi:HD-GYP domain-containing protein (c-di-GMP phosphodiesterase class II)
MKIEYNEKIVNFDIDILQESIDFGFLNVFETFLFIKEIENYLEIAKEKMQKEILKECEKNGKEPINFNNYTFSKTQKTTYNFKNSQIWESSNKKLKEIEEKMKFALNSNSVIVDDITGEVFDVAEKKVTFFLKVDKNRK